MKSNIKKILLRTNKKTDDYEFFKIKNVINNYYEDSKNITIADIGSGFCEFSDFVKKNLNIDNITCIDLNPDLVELAKNKGFKALNGNIIELPFRDSEFDIVHCSHVIEHLTYPDVIKGIEELFRVTKKNGLIIIRTPLWANHRFYNDIDHIRPYPPASILNYFNNKQQQNVGKIEVKEVARWYTKIYFEIDPNRYNFSLINYINLAFKISWTLISFPKARPNNYGIVFLKV